MANVNKVILMGKLTEDPEDRVFNNYHLCVLKIATVRSYRQKGEMKQKTMFHRVVAWGSLAQYSAQNFHKGSTIYIEGYLETEEYRDQAQNLRHRTNVVAEDVQTLGVK